VISASHPSPHGVLRPETDIKRVGVGKGGREGVAGDPVTASHPANPHFSPCFALAFSLGYQIEQVGVGSQTLTPESHKYCMASCIPEESMHGNSVPAHRNCNVPHSADWFHLMNTVTHHTSHRATPGCIWSCLCTHSLQEGGCGWSSLQHKLLCESE